MGASASSAGTYRAAQEGSWPPTVTPKQSTHAVRRNQCNQHSFRKCTKLQLMQSRCRVGAGSSVCTRCSCKDTLSANYSEVREGQSSQEIPSLIFHCHSSQLAQQSRNIALKAMGLLFEIDKQCESGNERTLPGDFSHVRCKDACLKITAQFYK